MHENGHDYILQKRLGSAAKPLLEGNPTKDIEAIKAAFQKSQFYYQFHKGNWASKIMRCYDPGELSFIITKVIEKGFLVIIQPNYSQLRSD